MNKIIIKRTLLSLSVLASCMAMSSPGYAVTLEEAFAAGKADINMRYRYESHETGTKDGYASTLRTRLGFSTGDYNNVTAHVDFEYLVPGGNYDDGNPLRAGVADPETEELNQAWINYTGLASTSIKLGRQRIILDNARFIGNVGWRQNEQTYDALTVINKSFADTTITYSFLDQVNTPKNGEVNASHTILNIGFDKTPVGKVTTYAYMLDNKAAGATSDHTTLGIRLKGAKDSILYTAEYAQQSDSGDSTTDFSPSYLFLEAGLKMDDTKIFVGQETLGSDNGVGFATPLATGHAFNGWADKFLATPGTGLNDVYIKAVTKFSGLKFVGLYHDFSADTGGADYGTELDLLLIKPINKNVKALIKFADFSAETGADTQKIWLALEAKFSQ